MVEVTIARLGLDASTNAYVVVLQETGGERMLPIWIGQAEAESIVMEIHDLKRPRPLTHDLCKNIIVGLGGELRRATITHVEQNTYYAELQIVRDGAVIAIDARPSDAIAVALRLGAPVFAAAELLSEIALEIAEPDDAEASGDESDDADDEDADEQEGGLALPSSPPAPDASVQQLQEYLERLRPEDFGKFNP